LYGARGDLERPSSHLTETACQNKRVSVKAKAKLKAIHAQLDVVTLKQQIDTLLEALKPSRVRPAKLA
jgi:uncharacterized membrane protein